MGGARIYSFRGDPLLILDTGVPTRRTCYAGRTDFDQESRQAAPGESRVIITKRRAVLCAALLAVVEEVAEGGYTAVVACAYCGRARRYVEPLFYPWRTCVVILYHIQYGTDHDDRIPLFMKVGESDPDLPYAPLLRYEPTASWVSMQDINDMQDPRVSG